MYNMYTVSDFYNIHKKNNYKLPPSVIQTINELCTSIGIDVIFEFKQTITQTKQDIIRELNKITEESTFDNVLSILTDENIDGFAEDIFTILTSNKYLMKKNCMLFTILKKYSAIQQQFEKVTEQYKQSFESIRVGNQDNYDLFCEINKENDKRKTYGIFLTELDRLEHTHYGEEVCSMILTLLNEQLHTGKKDIFNEYIDNIAILSKYTIYQKEQIEKYTEVSPDIVGSRFIFTCMDILQL